MIQGPYSSVLTLLAAMNKFTGWGNVFIHLGFPIDDEEDDRVFRHGREQLLEELAMGDTPDDYDAYKRRKYERRESWNGYGWWED